MSAYDGCPRYWRGCFSCPEFMRSEIFFCRRANRVRYGSDVASVDDEREYKAGMKRMERTGGAWWSRELEGSRE